MQAAGQWDSWDSWDRQSHRHTHSGIIIKSNLVSFKCDLYAESVCPFFPKTKRPKTKKKKRKNWKSNPIPSNSVQSRRPASRECSEWRWKQKEKQFWKVPKTKRYFVFVFLSSFLIEINLNCFLEKPQDKRHQRGWKNASDLVYKAYPSDTFACVCAHNRYYYIWKINPFGYPGKYSHAYAQICWQLFRWISINPRVPGKPMWEHRSGISTHRDLCSPA